MVTLCVPQAQIRRLSINSASNTAVITNVTFVLLVQGRTAVRHYDHICLTLR
jgi:hypothetical protein